MNTLRSQKLLLIVPHFKVFIRDQATLIRSYFNKVTVLMPTPYFSSLALKLPYIKKFFRFLKFVVESRVLKQPAWDRDVRTKLYDVINVIDRIYMWII